LDGGVHGANFIVADSVSARRKGFLNTEVIEGPKEERETKRRGAEFAEEEGKLEK
jgi:hypothetical protein